MCIEFSEQHVLLDHAVEDMQWTSHVRQQLKISSEQHVLLDHAVEDMQWTSYVRQQLKISSEQHIYSFL